MTEKRVEGSISEETVRTDSETQENEGPQKEDSKVEEKPLEKMKKTELLKKIRKLKEESEKNYDQYLRSKAEIENIVKRNKKEKEEWVKYSNDILIKEILPVMDNLEMAISHSQNDDSFNALKEGVELTLKGLKDTLIKSGLEELKAEGEPFDPCFHHAVSEQDNEDVEAGIVLKELQKGYTLNQRLIRPAMVILSKGNTSTKESDDKASKKVCEQ
ncbi:MAG: nucleotide exchange factor GrpE [Deltaproteobacteria bacterium]|nr:nucleotide exchange factor GrpE [Deltaproteobacteria bacterium]